MDRSYASGQEVFVRYSSIVDAENLPFVRASGSERVIQSATNWTAGTCHCGGIVVRASTHVHQTYSGFAAASNDVYAPVLSVIISEKVCNPAELAYSRLLI